MVAILLRLIAGAAVTWLGYELLKDDKKKEKGFSISRASNCHEIFQLFSQALSIPSSKRQKLIQARIAIENRLKEYFRNKPGLETPKSWIQGSYKLGTIIRTKQDNCDLDLGLYFFNTPNLEAKTYLQNVSRALSDHTLEKVVLKNKCVRVYYQQDFHIDIPVYYRNQSSGKQLLATKNNGWEISDPKLFWDWFKRKTLGKPQLVRVIKFTKAWLNEYSSKTNRKSPSGLAITIWCIKYYLSHDRDDAAFFYTCLNIRSNLKGSPGTWECKMPVKPSDDLIIKLDLAQRRNFREGLEAMLREATRAVVADSKAEAAKIWRGIFGKWFPENEGPSDNL